jgi:hypothetical protein
MFGTSVAPFPEFKLKYLIRIYSAATIKVENLRPGLGDQEILSGKLAPAGLQGGLH